MRLSITDAVKHIIIINIVFWIGTLAIGTYGNVFNDLFAMHFPLNEDFKFWQVITHMFMHASYVNTGSGMSIFVLHILFNMLGVWMFGTPLEQRFGTKKFLFLYFSAGLGATLLPLIFDYYSFYSNINLLINNGFEMDYIISLLNQDKYDTNWISIIGNDGYQEMGKAFYSSALGASGCLMGLLVGYGLMFPNAELMLIFLPIPIKAKYFIPLLLGYEIISGFTGGTSLFGLNVGHWAHVGGAIIGFIIVWYWRKNSMDKYRWN